MDSFALVIFGITGNLAQIKLIPALYRMAENGILPADMSIIGVARSPKTREEFVEFIKQVLQSKTELKPEVFDEFIKKLHYINGNLDDQDFYQRLKNYMDELTNQGNSCKNRIYYLATYPDLYHHVFENLHKFGLNTQDQGWVRLMIEKPIGNDLSSAKALNELLHNYFTEDQIYRLDHYLGKETLQNILTFRFGNSILEPITNSSYIDHIQITSSEDFGIGKRGGYYDSVGALKDVGQNHLLQMLAFVTMDAPLEFSNDAVTKERLKILKNLIPLPDKTVFGQYEGYKTEDKVFPDSTADTFFAFKTVIDSDRFKEVPIYIRAGKKMKQTVTEIVVVYKQPLSTIFKNMEGANMQNEQSSFSNKLTYRIQPNEGIVFEMLTKKPGHGVELEPQYLQFCYRLDPHGHYLPDPYEKLIADTIRGDQTFFNDAEEVEAQWAFIDSLSAAKKLPIPYPEGTWGPKEADQLIEADGRKWIEPSLDFCKI